MHWQPPGIAILPSARDGKSVATPARAAFEAAVKEGHVGAVMTSYNLVNGHHMSQYGAINNDIVKNEWGFDGVIMSDWTSYDAIAAANGGLDVEMPSGEMMNRKNLVPAIQQGKVSQATIDDKVRRILRLAVRFGWIDRDQTDASIPKENPQGREAALQGAREGMVLLKNDASLLPIDRAAVKKIAIIGPLAHPAVPVGGGSAAVQPHAAVSFRDGLTSVAGPGVSVSYHRGVAPVTELADRMKFSRDDGGRSAGLDFEGFSNTTLSGRPAVTRVDPRINLAGPFFKGSDSGEGSSARWSGYFTAEKPGPHRVAIQTTRGDGGYRVYIDDKLLLDNWRLGKPLVTHAGVNLTNGPHRVRLEQYRRAEWGNAATRLGIVHDEQLVDPVAKTMAAQADIVVAAVGFDTESEGEASDRAFALPLGQDDLIRTLVDANRKIIVTITSGGGVDMTRWIDRVPALVQTWYPGQEGGWHWRNCCSAWRISPGTSPSRSSGASKTIRASTATTRRKAHRAWFTRTVCSWAIEGFSRRRFRRCSHSDLHCRTRNSSTAICGSLGAPRAGLKPRHSPTTPVPPTTRSTPSRLM